MDGDATGRSLSKPENALVGDSTRFPQAADPAAEGKGKDKMETGLSEDGHNKDSAGDGESVLSPSSPGGGTSNQQWFGKAKGIIDKLRGVLCKNSFGILSYVCDVVGVKNSFGRFSGRIGRRGVFSSSLL